MGTAPEASTPEKVPLCSDHCVVQLEETDNTLSLTSDQLLILPGNIGYALLQGFMNAPLVT